MQVKVTPPPAHVTHPTTSGAAKGEEAALLSSFVCSVAQKNCTSVTARAPRDWERSKRFYPRLCLVCVSWK